MLIPVNTCDKHEGAKVEYTSDSCPICAKNGHEVKAGSIPVAAFGQMAAAALNVGLGMMDLVRLSNMHGVRFPIGVPSQLERSPMAQAALRQIESGFSMAQSALTRANSSIVVP